MENNLNVNCQFFQKIEEAYKIGNYHQLTVLMEKLFMRKDKLFILAKIANQLTGFTFRSFLFVWIKAVN